MTESVAWHSWAARGLSPVSDGAASLERGHAHDVALRVVGRTGRLVALGGGDRRRGHADDSGRQVRLLRVQGHRLLELSVQTGATAETVRARVGKKEGEDWGKGEREREIEREEKIYFTLFYFFK